MGFDTRNPDFSGRDGEDGAPSACPKRDQMVEKITSGFGEAVYVAGWNEDGFVSAIAEAPNGREIAAGILHGADAGMAVFVSGPASEVDHFCVSSGGAKQNARRALFNEACDDTFSRLGEVDMPPMPVPTDMDPECLVVSAAYQASKKALTPSDPMAKMLGQG